MILKASVSAELAGMRLDDGARQLFPDLSKTQIRRIIDWGGCTISDALVRVASRQLREGDLISLGVMEPERCVEIAYGKEDLLYEDGGYLAINKAAGLNSQRTPYQLKGTVEYAVDCYLKSLGSKERPGSSTVSIAAPRGDVFPEAQEGRHPYFFPAQGGNGGKGLLGAGRRCS